MPKAADHWLVDLVAHAQVGGEVPADALVGEAVDVGVVQRAVLRAAVARAAAWPSTAGRSGSWRAPWRASAGCCGWCLPTVSPGVTTKPSFSLMHRIGIGDAAAQVQALGEHVGAVERDLQARRGLMRPTFCTRLMFRLAAGSKVVCEYSESRVSSVKKVRRSKRVAEVLLGRQLGGPRLLGLQVRVVDVLRVGGRGRAVEFADRRACARRGRSMP